ncbi:6-phosphofructokinase [Alkalibacter rhizosphaerae]|uniref:ATP-dependent 6-phosphofructokinase n=1 Tax=Alkalibacter rhizosphaerae TaxID=2815577 RepID=A0A974XDF9_9FIRM|nr:6-phosphofructokinase [Alkalibacter rhizosphaerae]QSX07817.1 6-phosphofructokinase [Alkalibacter rhizosphaerae]
MKRIGVLTSGGDAPGMNAAIRAVVRTAVYNKVEVYGIKRGFSGLLEEDIEPLNVYSVADIIHRGGTILRSSRSEYFKTDAGQKKAIQVLEEFNIDSLIVIGGDGSFKGARALSNKGVNTISLPGTIDNDIGCTDYSIGFDTALNTALDAIGKIRDTTSSHNRVNVVEVMGRDCGEIALFAGLAGGAESILVPERDYDLDAISDKLLRGKDRGKLHSIIVLAEGVGNFEDFCKKIEEKTGVSTRGTNLGYIQRGGSPTAFDRILASRMGYMAVNLLLDGKTNRVIGIRDNKYLDMDTNEALEIKKEFDMEAYRIADVLSI